MVPRLWTLRRPSFNFRNHRKILIIDHRIAFTGGMNVGDEYSKQWLDAHVLIRGSSISALEDVMLDDWYYSTKAYVPASDSPRDKQPGGSESNQDSEDTRTSNISSDEHTPERHENTAPLSRPLSKIPTQAINSEDTQKNQGILTNRTTILASGPDSPQPWIHDAYFRIMAAAKRRLWIMTPYFIPSESITTALRTAAGRGVDVRILVPEKSDLRIVSWASRAYYPDLVAAGVNIYEYEPSMLHAKVLIADASTSSIGTANLDPRSFRLNFEVACIFESREVNAQIEKWYLEQLAHAHLIDQSTLKKIPRHIVLRDAAAHLFSPLL